MPVLKGNVLAHRLPGPARRPGAGIVGLKEKEEALHPKPLKPAGARERATIAVLVLRAVWSEAVAKTSPKDLPPACLMIIAESALKKKG